MLPENFEQAHLQAITRRHFFQKCQVGIGAMGLASLMNADVFGAAPKPAAGPMSPKPSPYKAKAKNVIFLFMAGGPTQFELFVDKPKLREYSGHPTPESFMKGRRFAFLKPDAKLLGGRRPIAQYGQCGASLSDLLPCHRAIVDDICFIHSMATDVFNHAPAKLFVNTGSPQPGRPAMGAWVTYGLGSESKNLPGFVVLQSGPRGPRGGATLWSSGFLPTTYQGVPFRSGPEPILDLASPPGYSPARQKDFIDTVADLNTRHLTATGDAEIATRIRAYEMAYRMQTSAPELMEINKEPQHILDLYGAVPGKPSFANNCLLARRLIERGSRFVQLYHTNWDHHGGPTENLEVHLPQVARDIDQASSALVLDLKARGLLDDTIVIWGGEFGRTPMGEPREKTGRDHHIDAYTMWLAGGGIKPGFSLGQTDELGLGVTEDRVHVHDLQATIMHLLGIDHEKLTFRFQGRDFRLTDVHGKVVQKILV